jgi:hypothetical protein
VDFGPAFQRGPDGTYQVDIRTVARSEYTKCLLAIYPWADTVDLETFLMGFDAGEQWCRHNQDTLIDIVPNNPAWLSLAKENIDHAIKFSKDQISEETPAAIAGVTRKLR